MKIALIGTGILIVVYLLFSLIITFFFGRVIYATPRAFAPTKEKVYDELKELFGYSMERYETWPIEKFTVKNGSHTIPAQIHPVENARGIAIVVHGFGQNRYVMMPQAEILRKLGFSTILYDQRAFGECTGEPGSFGIWEGQDCAAMIDYVRAVYGADTKIVLCGASMGAMSVLNSQLYTKPVDAIIEDSSPDHAVDVLKPFYRTMLPLPNPFLYLIVQKSRRLGVDMRTNNPIEPAGRSSVPILVMHGEADRTVPIEMGRNIKSVLKNPKSRMEIFAGKDHTLEVAEFDRYERIVAEFIGDVFSI